MFKPTGQSRAKSPYQPKLLQALIDSSDEDNFSIGSEDQAQVDNFDSDQFQEGQSDDRKSQYTNLFCNDDKRSIKSVYTSMSQQTLKVRPSADLNQTKNVKQSNLPTSCQSNISKPETLNLTRFTQSKQAKQTYPKEQQLSQISQKPKSSHSPNMAIKYDTLKLSEYNSKQIKKQEQLYQHNLKEFRQKFNSSKPSQNDQILIQNQKQEIDDYMDSLQAMKRSNLNRRHFSRKSLTKEVSTPSSRIKFLQEQKQQNADQRQDSIHLIDGNTQIQRLRQQLKRSKDIIKTLGLKNSDLQKDLEMKNIQLLEYQSEQNSRLIQAKGMKERQQAEKKVYGKINFYMKERVKEFMEEIKNIKMSPLLQQSLEAFLAEILQLNQVTVEKKIKNNELSQTYQEQREPLKELSQNTTPNRLSKSIFNTKTEIDQKQDHQKFSTTSNQFRNRFQTNYPQSHIEIGKNRQNAFISTKSGQNDESLIKGYSIKVDLSSNKQNITPNKKPQADDELRQLQKSLQKLKAMEKQLSTPVPKNPFTTNKSHFVSNPNDDYRTEYSIINRSHLSGFAKDQNSSMNMSANNLDRSKSRRKKIFADTNQK